MIEDFMTRKLRIAEAILMSSTIDDLYSTLLRAKEEIERCFPEDVRRVKEGLKK